MADRHRTAHGIGDTARAFNAMAKELDAQDQARRHMMADIAHELRTPLAIVQGKLEGLLDGVYPRDDERLQGLLEERACWRDWSKTCVRSSTAESGALALSKEPTDFVALAHDVVSSLVGGADCRGSRCEWRPSRARSSRSRSIPLRIREVLINLVANALHTRPRRERDRSSDARR